MKKFTLEKEIWVPETLQKVFSFFSDANNLALLTPPWVQFKILSPQPIIMKPGTLIDYQIKIHQIPLKWRSEITVWEPPYRFIDEQRKGPYRIWIHEHTFQEQKNGVYLADRVEYAVWGGNLIHELFIKKDLERIFNFRHEVIKNIFNGKNL